MRALNTIVVVMGIMLVVGFAALIVVIAGRVSRGGSSTETSRLPPRVDIDIPRGARVGAMTTAPNRLILDLVLPSGEHQLLIIDLVTGARIGTIELRPVE